MGILIVKWSMGPMGPLAHGISPGKSSMDPWGISRGNPPWTYMGISPGKSPSGISQGNPMGPWANGPVYIHLSKYRYRYIFSHASHGLNSILNNNRKSIENDRNDRTLIRKWLGSVVKRLDSDWNTVGHSSPHRALGEHCLRCFGNLSNKYLLDFEVNISPKINILANMLSEIDQYLRISSNLGT